MLSIAAHSQISKGSMYLGVGLNFSSTSSEQPAAFGNGLKSSRSDLTVGPTAGYFIKDNVALGLTIGYSYSSTKNVYSNYSSLTTGNTVSFSPYTRYYFNLGKKTAIFTQFSAGYAYGGTSTRDHGSLIGNSNTSIISASILPGLSYFLSNKCALEATIGSMGYSFSQSNYTPTVSPDNVQKTTSSSFSSSISTSTIHLGFKYFIRK